MGKSNRTASLERKISLLLGEREDKIRQINRALRLYEEVPSLQARVSRAGKLIFYCEEIIKDDQPDWTPEDIKAQKPFAHKIPIRFGQAIKMALDILRESQRRMTVREIAAEVLFREGHNAPEPDIITNVANNIGNQFRKRNRPYLENDGQYPAHWWVRKPE